MISGREDDSHDARRNDSCASAREGACLCVDRFWAMLPHCAINKPKKNHVGFRISQVKLDTPTTQTPRHTIHSFCGKGGNALTDRARTPSKAQKSESPITPCSTRTDKKVLCAGGAGGRMSLPARIGSAKTRLTRTRNAFAPIPTKGCDRKSSQ